VLPVPVPAKIVLPPLELDYLDFLVPTVALDGRRYLAVLDKRFADGDLITVADEENPIELDFGPLFRVEPFDPQAVALLDAVLLAARRYYRIHAVAPIQARCRARRKQRIVSFP